MKGKFEAFYDNYTKQWSVRKKRTEICVIYPCISEDMANEFAKLLNELNDENKQLKQKIKSITEILNEDIGYIESFRKIEEVIE